MAYHDKRQGSPYGGYGLWRCPAHATIGNAMTPLPHRSRRLWVEPRPEVDPDSEMPAWRIQLYSHRAEETTTPANGGGSKGISCEPAGDPSMLLVVLTLGLLLGLSDWWGSGNLGGQLSERNGSRIKIEGSGKLRLTHCCSQKLQNKSKLIGSPPQPEFKSKYLATSFVLPRLVDAHTGGITNPDIGSRKSCTVPQVYVVREEKSDGPTYSYELRVQSGFLDQQKEGQLPGVTRRLGTLVRMASELWAIRERYRGRREEVEAVPITDEHGGKRGRGRFRSPGLDTSHKLCDMNYAVHSYALKDVNVRRSSGIAAPFRERLIVAAPV
ncbi:hypothetical protein H4582DRAFT_2059199 [Lactarius indigo]|nr:hypothetical protein H4582DRAFT_2059199 [Lactarius indigo]